MIKAFTDFFTNLTPFMIFAQSIGFIGIILNASIYPQKSHKKQLIIKWISDGVWMVHYFLIGAIHGGIVCIIAFFREIVFLNRQKKWAKSKAWPVIFICISIVSAIITYYYSGNLSTVFSMVASVISIISFWQTSPKTTRILAFPISGFMITYGLINMSIPAIINEIMTLTTSTIGVIRLDIKKKQ